MAEWQGRSGVALCHPSLTSAGKAILTKAIRRAGWSTDQFAICQPHDIPANTRAIVALSDQAQEALTGWFGGKRSVKYTRGYLLQGFSGLPVIPTFDPTQLAQGQMKLLGLLMNDIGVALQAAVGARKVCLDPKTVTNYRVGLDALRELYAEAVADPNLLVAFDLETATSWGEDEDESIEFSRDVEDGESDGSVTSDSDNSGCDDESTNSPNLSRNALDIAKAGIRTVQFSLHPGTGVSCDWSDECRDWVQRIMQLPNPQAGHNSWLFDEPILRNHGVEVREGTHDTLWMWHHLQPDLPAHLQGVSSLYGMPFPWKHLSGADLDFYGAADVDAVQRIMLGLPVALKRLGLWDGYERYVRQFRPVLSAMERRGIPVSREKLEELRTWLTEEVTRMDSELQPMIPTELKGRKVWKSWPADTKPLVEEYKQSEIAQIKSALEAEGKKVTKKALSLVVKPGDLPEPHRSIISEELGYQWDGDQLYKTLDFNPRSSDQILQFIRAKGYPVPKRFKDQKDTTSDKELERLEVKTKDPVISLVRSIRAYSKMGNAYAGKLREDGSVEGGWYPGPDGRLRATFSYGPATGQLSAKSPNVLTTPKRRAELANKFRQCIVAEPGHKLVECVTPDTPILTSDLIWKGAGDLEIGDSLIGFDQEPVLNGGSKRSGRYLRKTEVVSKHLLRKPCVRLKTDQGVSIKCSTDHLLLVRRQGKARWIEAGQIRVGEPICFFTHPWEVVRDYESGWLAGFLDGEGFCSDKEKHGRGVGFGQNPGAVSDKAVRLIEDLGFECKKEKTTTRRCVQYQISGHQFAWLRLLGMVRPIRLLQKAINQIEGMAYWGKRSKSAIVLSKEDIGEQDVVAIETTTGTFIANGMLSHNCDYTAFHARTLGLAAQDAAYMKLAAMDIHSFVAGHMIKYPGIETALTLSDGDLKQLLEEIKSKHKNVRNFKAKPAILGIGFKMGKRRLYYENRDSYESEAEAGKLISLLHELFPNVFKWQDAICEKADKDGRLINSWGACRWFWDVMKWTRRDGQWVKSTGRDAEKATAYVPSSNAHFMLRDKLLQAQAGGPVMTERLYNRNDYIEAGYWEIEQKKRIEQLQHNESWLDRYGLINVIHDAVLFHCPTNLVDECVHNIKALMEAPVQQMADPKVAPAGFTCGAEAMVGSDWSNMEEIH